MSSDKRNLDRQEIDDAFGWAGNPLQKKVAVLKVPRLSASEGSAKVLTALIIAVD